jgi:hypothetical protein
MKRFWIASILAFIFIFFWSWLYNGIILQGAYSEVAGLFRPREEMVSFFRWLIIGEAGLALVFVAIYASGFAGGGIASGIRLGILLELFAVSARFMIYATQPFPAKLLMLISAGGFVEMIGTGIIVGAIYKPASKSA